MAKNQPVFPELVAAEQAIPKQPITVRGKTGDIVQRNYRDLFWRFIYDRHLIWYKRFVLEMAPPWTTDVILRDYKFTNMYRELDRGTLYLLDNIIGPLQTHGTPGTQIFNTIIYRLFNRVDAWQTLRDAHAIKTMPWDRTRMLEVLRERMEAGFPIYTDAHMVCAYHGTPGKDKLERLGHIFDNMQPKIEEFEHLVYTAKSLKFIWEALKNTYGIGPFLAYEIAVDISYAPWNNLSEDEWVNPGPGCQIGINILYPGTSPKDCTHKIFEIRDMQQAEFKRMSLPFSAIAYKNRWLTLRNIEHDLCEFQKYVKALDGTGRPRNRFRPVATVGDDYFERLKG